MTGVKVPDDIRALFDNLIADTVACQHKYANFSAVIHEEQKELSVRAKNLWAKTMEAAGLQGEWRYEDGMVYPVDETETK